MIREIIHIEEDKCNGCGICITACHEGAIALVNGKAKLIRDDYCDGLGNCLPVCPTGAITTTKREAAPFDEEAVLLAMKQKTKPAILESQLKNWPVQIKLAPTSSPYFQNAHLLIAADCTAYSFARFHEEFMHNRITIIGCPKLDEVDYSEKLTQIFRNHTLQSITIVRMEVPCCGGIVHAVKNAIKNSDTIVPWQIITISTEGKILPV